MFFANQSDYPINGFATKIKICFTKEYNTVEFLVLY